MGNPIPRCCEVDCSETLATIFVLFAIRYLGLFGHFWTIFDTIRDYSILAIWVFQTPGPTYCKNLSQGTIIVNTSMTVALYFVCFFVAILFNIQVSSRKKQS